MPDNDHNGGGGMCVDASDFMGSSQVSFSDASDSEPVSCSMISAHLGAKMAKPWDDMTCDEIRSTTWQESDGSTSTAMMIMGLAGPTCCGSVAQTRCSDPDNMCLDASDFDASAVAFTKPAKAAKPAEAGKPAEAAKPAEAVTCAQAHAFLSAMIPASWATLTCAEAASIAWEDDGSSMTLAGTMAQHGAACCGGSPAKVRCHS
jgi:hypothetical protein